MCLGIPGKVVEIYEEHDMLMGKVDFGGVSKRVCLAHTPDVVLGKYVIVHVGFSLQVIDEVEAEQVFAFLNGMNELQDLSIGETWEPQIEPVAQSGLDISLITSPVHNTTTDKGQRS